MSYAGFWKRFVALIIDGFVLYFINLAISIVLGIFAVSAFGFLGMLADENDPDAALFIALYGIFLLASLINMVIHWLYYTLMESSGKQGTLGKMALGIKVTDLNGERISFAKANGRYFGKILSGIILLIGFLMAAFTEKKQGLHDIIADCLVVNKN